MFFGIEYFSAKTFGGVLLSSSLSTSYFNFNNLPEWERFAAMLIFFEKQFFAVLLKHIGAGKTSFAVNHTFEMCKTAHVVASFKKKFDILFHSSGCKEFMFKEFNHRFPILCKVLESKSSNNKWKSKTRVTSYELRV